MTVIGLTALEEKHPENGHTYTKTNAAYISFIERLGALPLVIPSSSRLDRAGAVLDRIDGLILTGGGDVNPILYGERMRLRTEEVDPKRDAFEITLALAALERGVPLFGICRGMQLLNVACGGTLTQDLIRSAVRHRIRPFDYTHTHPVEIVPKTLLHRSLRRRHMDWNSEHHQAIEQVAPGFVVAARSADGVIEAIEHPEHRFALGIQAHPEHQGRVFDPLMRTFVATPRRLTIGLALSRLAQT